MRFNVYCLAHQLRDTNGAMEDIQKIQTILQEQGVAARVPKLGYHITLLPPFRTTEDVAKSLAFGMDYMDAVRVDMGARVGIIGTKFDFFRATDEDAFIIRLKIDENILRTVERWRSRLSEIADWVYPPESYDYNPHLTLVKGPQIYGRVNRLLSEGVIPASFANIVSDMEAPRVLLQDPETRAWRPVR